MEESKEHRCRRELVEALGLDDSDGIHLWDDLLDVVRGYVKIAKSAVSGLEKPDGEYFIPWAKRVIEERGMVGPVVIASLWANINEGEAATLGCLRALVSRALGFPIQVNPPRTGDRWLVYAITGVGKDQGSELVGLGATEFDALLGALERALLRASAKLATPSVFVVLDESELRETPGAHHVDSNLAWHHRSSELARLRRALGPGFDGGDADMPNAVTELRSSLDVKSALIEWMIGQLTAASGRSDSEIREQLDVLSRLRSSQPLDPDMNPTCSSESRFPVLNSLKNPDIPTSVPWWLVAPHERQAMRNHGGQTLARLAERGGLSPLELYKIVHDQGFSWPTKEDEAAALEWLRQVAGSESR